MPRISAFSIKCGRVLPTEPQLGTRVRRAWDAFLARPCEPMTLVEAAVEPAATPNDRERVLQRLRELGLDVRTYRRFGRRGGTALYWCVGRTHPDDRYEDFLAARLDEREGSV